MPWIERPNAEDVDAMARLFLEDMTDLGVSSSLEGQRAVAAAVLEDLASERPDCLCWVARLEEGGPAVGVILANFNWSLKFEGRALWIEELYVTPSARRNGLGQLLVDELLDWAEDHEIRGIDLEAYQGNTPASVLYRSLGFHRLGRERFYYRIGSEEFL